MVERRLRLATALWLLAALASCQGYVGAKIESLFYTEYVEPSFDSTTDLMAPEGVRITSSADRQIGLAWNPVLVGDVAGYAVTRSDREDGPYTMIGRTLGRFAAVYSDSGEASVQLGDGKTYHYRIQAFDTQGRVGKQYTSVSGRTDPRPAIPSGFQAYSNLPRRIALAWEPSISTAVVGYSIFRSPSLGGTFEALTYVNGRLNTVFEDPVLGDLRMMYYRIQAVNRFGGASDLSEPVRAVTKAEPLPPTGLAAGTPALGQVDLRWEPNVEPDLTTYQIWRQLQDQSSERPVASVAAGTTEFSDRSLSCGEHVRYRLRALDRDGLVSAFSDPLELTALDLDLQLARSPNGGFELRWKPDSIRGWPALHLVEHRRLLPDRELGIARANGTLPVSLAPGRHEIIGTPTADVPGAAAADPARPSAEAPTCTARIDVPAAP